MRQVRQATPLTYGLAFAVGVLGAQGLPALPPCWSMALLALVTLMGLWRWPSLRLPLVVLLGFAWAVWRGSMAMQTRLPHALEGRDITVIGQVVNLPKTRPHATTFQLRVTQSHLHDRSLPLHGLVRLAWYGRAPPLVPCARWRLRVRLKRPRGMLNPGGMDRERYALARGIVAVGYVRKDAGNAHLSDVAWCVDRLRAKLAAEIQRRVSDAQAAHLLRALIVGDTRGLSAHDWQVARVNGVSHLLAISGLHIGVAALLGIWLARLLYFLFPRLGEYWPRPLAQAVMAMWVAVMYGALAGFSLPTLRTLLMLGTVVLARCQRRHVGSVHTLVLALTIMLVVDPLSVLSPGFWLSFAGVAFLLLCLGGSGRGWWRDLLTAQWVMMVALLPLGLWFFGAMSLIGGLSNLVAVPLVSLFIVPCALLGLLCWLLYPPLATLVWNLAAFVLHAQWWLLVHAASWHGAYWYLPEVRLWALLLALPGAFWLLMPRGVPLRLLGAFLFLPLLWPPLKRPPVGAFRAYVLDVGQGLAVLVQTHQHTLVYDTGARYPSGFNMGQAVVIPALRALGIRHLDRLIISHADNDHAGGAAAVVGMFPHALRLTGEPEKLRTLRMAPCLAGQSWKWDGVNFRIIHPLTSAVNNDANDRSCVLLVSGTGGRLLLTGDITRYVEGMVARAMRPGLPLVLQVPHHGSASSSSAAFITAIAPTLAVVSAGWRNRFGHPRPEVLKRYARFHVPVFGTARSGAVEVDVPASGRTITVTTWRQRHRHYWHE